jgi:WhiB family redox-sensing transcriptional regulator
MTLNVTTAPASAARAHGKAALPHTQDSYWATIDPGEMWRKRAACRHTEPDLFFPVPATGASAAQSPVPSPAPSQAEQAQAERAKNVCAGCPVRRECLQFALATRQAYGVWGGLELTESDRRRRPVRTSRPRG